MPAPVSRGLGGLSRDGSLTRRPPVPSLIYRPSPRSASRLRALVVQGPETPSDRHGEPVPVAAIVGDPAYATRGRAARRAARAGYAASFASSKALFVSASTLLSPSFALSKARSWALKACSWALETRPSNGFAISLARFV